MGKARSAADELKLKNARGNRAVGDDVEGHGFTRSTPDELKLKNARGNRATGDDVEGHGFARSGADELKLKNARGNRATGDDVEGHSFNRNAPEEFKGSRLGKGNRITPGEGVMKGARATGEDDVEGHWMPDAGSSMRLAKARSQDIERDARQHQLANEARQARLDHDPKRTHQKG